MMSEDRFDRIEERLDRLQAGQNALRAEMSGHIGRVDGRVDKLDGRIGKLDGRVDKLDGRIGKLENRVGDLDRHMHVLHEDVIARIAAIPEYSGPTKAEFAELREMIERRLDPLERVVRRHDADIERLKRSRR
jgi:chromosome segregation ATPase